MTDKSCNPTMPGTGSSDPADYDDVADQYGDEFINWAGLQLANLIDPVAGERILDVGAGRGAVTRPLASRGTEVWTIDLSERMVEYLREIVPPERVIRGDAGDLPYADEEFDGVTAGYLATILPNKMEGMLTEWSRVLNPQGRLAVSEPGPIHEDWLWLHDVACQFFSRPTAEEHNRTISKNLEALVRLAADAGLGLEASSTIRRPKRVHTTAAAEMFLMQSGLEAAVEQLESEDAQSFVGQVRAGLDTMFRRRGLIEIDRCANLFLFERHQ
ncbi:class I SAM-dependent methyltransferase [Brevibacterium luteolum]|uniref:class I SAM-dependent methyltransferase n=1 Tax=Brevibacterium luteolum TaxID=199591 RepID=UPI001C237531|nr:methyltransferase domain-containing protein [Brevibacterium luteolum]